jgi:hypothetical protein
LGNLIAQGNQLGVRLIDPRFRDCRHYGFRQRLVGIGCDGHDAHFDSDRGVFQEALCDASAIRFEFVAAAMIYFFTGASFRPISPCSAVIVQH